jgi:hypothetical protein
MLPCVRNVAGWGPAAGGGQQRGHTNSAPRSRASSGDTRSSGDTGGVSEYRAATLGTHWIQPSDGAEREIVGKSWGHTPFARNRGDTLSPLKTHRSRTHVAMCQEYCGVGARSGGQKRGHTNSAPRSRAARVAGTQAEYQSTVQQPWGHTGSNPRTERRDSTERRDTAHQTHSTLDSSPEAFLFQAFK